MIPSIDGNPINWIRHGIEIQKNPHSSHPQDSPAERHQFVLGFQVLHLAAHWQCEKILGISVLWGWGLSGGGIIYVYIRYVICIYIYNLVLLFDI